MVTHASQTTGVDTAPPPEAHEPAIAPTATGRSSGVPTSVSRSPAEDSGRSSSAGSKSAHSAKHKASITIGRMLKAMST